MSDERHPIRCLTGTRPVASMTGRYPNGWRVVLVKAHAPTRRPSGPQSWVLGFATPMTGFHVRRVFDERCPAA
ncbi:hypothetical protein [Nonomuraea basaltis]|uniref:hypothetical protein n=1 Tax=Nonomuraea basaltis TaxID=2495887 RepID=UPI00110C711D|nr:hypothetical protein [Nonomuraea basaltis]TMR90694.1 hypothetical protein EJK15_53945 [Nonomuraea basaltis]